MPNKDDFLEFLKRMNIRLLILSFFMLFCAIGLLYRLFDLQIIRGADYLKNFQLRIRREVVVPGIRGNIYDRNGELLAYNQLAYSVVIRDTLEESSHKNADLNNIIRSAIEIIEKNGDTLSGDFGIALDENDHFYYTVSGQNQIRFLADIYGYANTEKLSEKQKAASAEQMINYLANRFLIGDYATSGVKSSGFIPGKGYDNQQLLKTVKIRYHLGLNSFQKYVPATIAFNVSEKTVATIMENSKDLHGVTVEESSIRKYTDSRYFSQILGYTGSISAEELGNLQKEDPSYIASDTVGKSGIELSMETELQGKKGKKTVYVDNLGRVLSESSQTDPKAGNDIYLTLDKDLQIAATDILEKYLSRIILSKIREVKEFDNSGENASSSDIIIPIYDVYYSVIKNNILDTDHFAAEDASSTEQSVLETYANYREQVKQRLLSELTSANTPYEDLSKEYRNYESYLVSLMYQDELMLRENINKDDPVYMDWTVNETASLHDFLYHAIEQNWINVSGLELEKTYSDTEEVYRGIISYMLNKVDNDRGFEKRLYRYMLLNDAVSGEQICHLLLDQKIVTLSEEEEGRFLSGNESAYTFMLNRILRLDLTPAQLNLDPYSGSMVITDPYSGEVLAMVSYPSYDNNLMSNGVDARYYEKLRNDLSTPLINYATYQETAPGSTFKMVSATAGLMEGTVSVTDTVKCTGIFDRIGKPAPRCWVYPGSHGELDVTGAIENSCNVFFYEVGYRLGMDENNTYDSSVGIEKISKYAQMYGLGDKTGLEIAEAAPQISSEDSVRSAIGQGNHNFTTAGLARYVSTVANGGTCYDLSLVKKTVDAGGNVLHEKAPVIHNIINMDESYWNAIHEGMKLVVEGKTYFKDFPLPAAGKTGTAQQTTTRPNHALFVCYAPYDAPRVSIATRIANGYTSDNAAQVTESVLEYYFKLKSKEELLQKELLVTGTQALGD